MISVHRRNCARWRGDRVLADDPGAAEVGAVAAVADADVDPQHVAADQLALGGQQRAGQVAVDGPRRLPPGLAASPARSGRARWRRAQLERAAEERRPDRSIWRTPGASRALDVGHGLLGDPQGPPHAGQLVGGLGRLGRADDPPRVDQGRRANKRCCMRRMAPVSSSTAITAPAGTSSASSAAKSSDALVVLQVHRVVQVAVGQLRARAGPLAERHEQVRHPGRRPGPPRPAGPRAPAPSRPAASSRRWRS